MSVAPRTRKLLLTVHLVVSVGWIGAALAYLGLGVSAVISANVDTVRAAWLAMELVGWWVIVPLALTALASGLVMSLSSGWGLFRHYWVVLSLILTVLATGVTVLHMSDVSAAADAARAGDLASLAALGGDLFHPGIGVVVLLVVTVLNVYKPRGMTSVGRAHRERAQSPNSA